MTVLSRSARVLTLALCAATLGILPTPPAGAAEPVTQPDAVSLYPGGATESNVLANDSDADGDELKVCRLGDSPNRKLKINLIDPGDLTIYTRRSLPPGEYTLTYYACDFETLSPETLTITVLEPPRIVVRAVKAKPGRIKVRNTADFAIRFRYGSFDAPGPDGHLKVDKNSSVLIRVQRHRIDWVAYTRDFQFLRLGHVRRIQLPPGVEPLPPYDAGPERLWAG